MEGRAGRRRKQRALEILEWGNRWGCERAKERFLHCADRHLRRSEGGRKGVGLLRSKWQVCEDVDDWTTLGLGEGARRNFSGLFLFNTGWERAFFIWRWRRILRILRG